MYHSYKNKNNYIYYIKKKTNNIYIILYIVK